MLNKFEKAISEIENFCKLNNIDHRFVGGASYSGLLNSKTTWKINFKKREIFLKNYNRLSPLRGDKTIKDIDLITFEKDEKNLNKLKEFYSKNKSVIPLSIENAIYYPKKINKLFQFVTSIYFSEHEVPSLIFSNIKQPISLNTLEKWTIILDNDLKYSTRNPIADFLAYHFRNPAGIKPKDSKKILLLKNLANDLIKQGKENDINYLSNNYFGTWSKYIEKLNKSKNINIIIKKNFMKLYWGTIGEYLAHGRGIGKYLQNLSDKFTG